MVPEIKKTGTMSLLTHSQMGLRIGALGVPELRRIPSGQLELPKSILKEDCNKKKERAVKGVGGANIYSASIEI